MGIIDKLATLLPRRHEPPQSRPERTDIEALRGDFDRWLQRLFDESREFPTLVELRWAPAADVYETDEEVVVTADVPGFDRDELDLTLIPEGLVIRGEKHEERDDGDRDSRFLEYRYGRFVRTVPLPQGLDLDRAEARLKNGVLTIRFPRTARARLRAV